MGLAEGADSAVEVMNGSVALDGNAAVEWLSRVSLPRLVIDSELHILWSNRAADAALSSGLLVSRRGTTLCFDDELGQDRWCDRFSEVGTELTRLVVVDHRAHPHAVLGAFRLDAAASSPVFLNMTAVDHSLDLERTGLSGLFGLTGSETRVAQMLVDLGPPREIAQSLGVSITTVRTHIRGIYLKLGVNSQRELLRLASSFCLT